LDSDFQYKALIFFL